MIYVLSASSVSFQLCIFLVMSISLTHIFPYFTFYLVYAALIYVFFKSTSSPTYIFYLFLLSFHFIIILYFLWSTYFSLSCILSVVSFLSFVYFSDTYIFLFSVLSRLYAFNLHIFHIFPPSFYFVLFNYFYVITIWSMSILVLCIPWADIRGFGSACCCVILSEILAMKKSHIWCYAGSRNRRRKEQGHHITFISENSEADSSIARGERQGNT